MTLETKSFDTLTQAFQEYRDESDTRLSEIENRLEKQASRSTHHSERLHLSTKNEQSESVEKAALSKYLVKGDGAALEALAEKSLSTLEGGDGGFLIPESLHPIFMQSLEDVSVMRNLCSVTAISTSKLDLLLMDEDAQVGWSGEADERAETETPHVRRLSIPVHEMYARPKATQKLLEDAAINIESWLAHAVGAQMAKTETHAFLFGDGEKKPRGVFSYEFSSEHNAPGAFYSLAPREEGGLSADMLIQALSSIESRHLGNASWLMSKKMLAHIRSLRDGDGRYLWQPATDVKMSSSLLGYPVVLCDMLEDASHGILFGDFKAAYQVVDRDSMHVLRDPYSAKPYVEFYTTKRVGGAVKDFSALVGLKVS